MSKTKRLSLTILVLVAVIALTVGMFGFGAAAAEVAATDVAAVGSNGYATVADAVAASSGGSVVKLLADVTENLTIDKNVTLDLNGHTLTGTITTTGTGTTAKVLTIKNGTVVSNGSEPAIINNQVVNLDDATVKAGTGLAIDNFSSVTFISGSIIGDFRNEHEATFLVTDDCFIDGTIEPTENNGVTLAGGVFTHDISYCAIKDGKMFYHNGTNYVVVDKAVAMADGVVVAIGRVGYKSLQDAVNAKDAATITLLRNLTADGVVVPAGKNVVIDLNGFTYTVDKTVGSAGTATNAFQLLQGATVELKNGTIESATAKILIQNYSDLTLRDVNLVGNSGTQYVVSNNNGNVVVTGDTNITATAGNVALDVCKFRSYPAVNVTFDKDFTGTVVGEIEYTGAADTHKLVIRAGNFDVTWDIPAEHGITVSGGVFTAELPESVVEAGMKCYKESEGKYILAVGDGAIKALNNGATNIYGTQQYIVLQYTDIVMSLATSGTGTGATGTEGYWMGVGITIPESIDLSVAMVSSNGAAYAPVAANLDGARLYTMWGLCIEGSANAYRWAFDWDNDGAADYFVYLAADPNGVRFVEKGIAEVSAYAEENGIAASTIDMTSIRNATTCAAYDAAVASLKADIDALANGLAGGTVSAITNGEYTIDDGVREDVITYKGLILKLATSGTGAQNTGATGVTGYWVGIKVTAPAGVDVTNATYKSYDGVEKSFNAHKDGEWYIQLWIPVSESWLVPEYAGCVVAPVYKFDWNGDGIYDYTVKFVIEIDGIRLVEPTVAAVCEYAESKNIAATSTTVRASIAAIEAATTVEEFDAAVEAAYAAIDALEEALKAATVVAITAGENTVTVGEEATEIRYTGLVLKLATSGTGAQNTGATGVTGYWVGINVIAPAGLDVTNATYKSYDGVEKSFNAYKDGEWYIQLWIPVSESWLVPEYAGCVVAPVYEFDWNGDGIYDYTVKFVIEIDGIRLVEPTVAAVREYAVSKNIAAEAVDVSAIEGAITIEEFDAAVEAAYAAIDALAEALKSGKITAITAGEATVNESNTQIVYTDLVLKKVVNGEGVEGYWIGIKVTAPAIDITNAKYYRTTSPANVKSFYANRDGEDYVTFWGSVTQEGINAHPNAYAYYAWVFDWNGDGIYDQEVKFYISMAGTRLVETGVAEATDYATSVGHTLPESAIAAIENANTVAEFDAAVAAAKALADAVVAGVAEVRDYAVSKNIAAEAIDVSTIVNAESVEEVEEAVAALKAYIDSLAETLKAATVVAITAGENTVTVGEEATEIRYTGLVLKLATSGTGAQNTGATGVTGYWVGIKVTAPAGLDVTNATYKSYDGVEKSFNAHKDGEWYIQLWISISESWLVPEFAGYVVAPVYEFDWNNDGIYDWTVNFVIELDGVRLVETGVQEVLDYATALEYTATEESLAAIQNANTVAEFDAAVAAAKAELDGKLAADIAAALAAVEAHAAALAVNMEDVDVSAIENATKASEVAAAEAAVLAAIDQILADAIAAGVAEVTAYAATVGYALPTSYTDDIEASTSLTEVDAAVAAAKAYIDGLLAADVAAAMSDVEAYATSKYIDIAIVESVADVENAATKADLDAAVVAAKAEIDALAEKLVASVGANRYFTLQEAIDNANGGTVILIKDTTESVVIGDTTPCLDLNGHILTNVAGKDTIVVTADATLTIVGDGTVDNVSHGKAALVNNGTVVLNGGSYTRSAEAGASATSNGGNSYYVVLNHGTLTINDGVTVSANGKYSSLVENGWQDGSKNTSGAASVLTINGGTFVGGINTIKNDECGELEINGGTFTNIAQHAIQNWNKAEINGGTFTVVGDGFYVVYNSIWNEYSVGELTISGGTFNGKAVRADNGKVVLTGTFTGSVLNTRSAAEVVVDIDNMADETVVYYTTNANAITVATLAAVPADGKLVAGRSVVGFDGYTIDGNYTAIVKGDSKWHIINAAEYADLAIAALTAHHNSLYNPFVYSEGGLADLDDIRADGIDQINACAASEVIANKIATMNSIVAAHIASMDEVLTRTKYLEALNAAIAEAVKDVKLYAAAKDVELTVPEVAEAVAELKAVQQISKVAPARDHAMDVIDEVAASTAATLAEAIAEATAAINEAAGSDVVVPTYIVFSINNAKTVEEVEQYKEVALNEIADIRTFRAEIAAITGNGDSLVSIIDSLTAALLDTENGYLVAMKADILGEIAAVQAKADTLSTSAELAAVKDDLATLVESKAAELAGYIANVTDKVDAVADVLGETIGADVTSIKALAEEIKASVAVVDGKVEVADSKIDALNAQLSALIANVQETANSILATVGTLATSEEAAQIRADIAALNNVSIDEVQAKLEALNRSISNTINNSVNDKYLLIVEKLETLAAGTDSKIDDVKRAIAGLNNVSLEDINAALAEVESNLNSVLAGVETKVDGIIATLATVANEDDMASVVSALEAFKGTTLAEMSDALANVEDSILAAVANVQAKAEETMEALAPLATRADLDAIRAEILGLNNLSIAEVQGALNNLYSQITASINGNVNAKYNSILAELAKFATAESIAEVKDAIAGLNNVSLADINEALANVEDRLTVAINSVKTIVDGITTTLQGVATAESIANVQAAVAALNNVSIDEIDSKLVGVQAALETAVASAKDAVVGETNGLAQALAALTGKIAANNQNLVEKIAAVKAAVEEIDATSVNGLAANIGAVKADIAALSTKLDALTAVENAKAGAVNDVNNIVNGLLDVAAVRSNAIFASESAVPAAREGAMDADTLYNKLLSKYSEANAKLIVSFYNDAIAAINNAESTSDVTLAVQLFKAKVATVDIVNGIDTTVDFGGVYALVAAAIVVSLVAVILVLVLLKRKNEVAPAPATVVNVNVPAVTETPVVEETVVNDEEVATQAAAVVEEVEEVEEVDEADEADDAEDEADEDDDNDDDDDSDDNGTEETVAAGDDAFAFSSRKPSKPFNVRLMETSDENLQVYSTLKNALCSYKKVKGRISKKCESFRLGRELIAKIAIVGKSVRMYIALDPAIYDENKFHHKDVSAKKSYALVPMMVRVKGPRATKRALSLIENCMGDRAKDNKYVHVDYAAYVKDLAKQAAENPENN